MYESWELRTCLTRHLHDFVCLQCKTEYTYGLPSILVVLQYSHTNVACLLNNPLQRETALTAKSLGTLHLFAELHLHVESFQNKVEF